MTSLRLCCYLLLPLLMSVPAQAHRFAPSLLRLVEVGEQEYNVVWKTPAQATSAVPLQPVLPDNCVAVGDGAGEMEGTGVVRSWRVRCPGGLVGKTLAVSGLAENQASVLSSLETADQRFYQALLSADQSEFMIPAEPTVLVVMKEYSWLGTEHIWSGIDHLLFVFGLLLLVGGGRRLLWTITAFTAGHSITLSWLVSPAGKQRSPRYSVASPRLSRP